MRPHRHSLWVTRFGKQYQSVQVCEAADLRSCIKDLRERLAKAEAALTAQQEPSGVREGMLRAAEICSRLDLDFQDGKCDPSPSDCAEAITRAAEQVNAEGQVAENRGDHGLTGGEPVPSAPTPQPADGVVVSQFNMMNGPSIPWSLGEALYAGYVAIGNWGQSIGTLNERGGFGWAEVAYMWAEHPRREKFKAAVKSALLAAAKEPRKCRD